MRPNLKNQESLSPLRPQLGVDGVMVSNTTVSRPKTLQDPHKSEVGGLSGQPLKDLSTDAVREMYSLTKGAPPPPSVPPRDAAPPGRSHDQFKATAEGNLADSRRGDHCWYWRCGQWPGRLG